MASFNGRDYQARIDALAQQGIDMHGEATLICSFAPATVLDAGCGTGRVAIELAKHGIEVIGVDVEESMIAEARRMAPELPWVLGDLTTLDLGRTFDLVVLAGNVPLFCPEPSRAALIARCAAHVAESGYLVAGFSLGKGYELREFDACCDAAGLQLVERWATWDREPYRGGGDYAVSVRRRPAQS